MPEALQAADAPRPSNRTAASTGRRAARGIWLNVHLWLGLSLGVIGALLGISGSVLVVGTEVDGWLHPSRYAIAGDRIALPLAEYVQRAVAARDGRLQPVAIRLPDLERGPVVVLVRTSANAGPLERIYLDPPSGRVLDIARPTDFIGWLHRFHESLALREYSGREIVGAVGIAMLISSLSGIYLWWPRGRLRRADFGFRRGRPLSRNLHYTFGIWGALLLALLSFTGIVIAFPEASRAVVGTFSKVAAPPRGVASNEAGGAPIGVDAAARIAGSAYPGSAVIGVGIPSGPRGVYRVSLREANDATPRSGTSVFIHPQSGAVVARVDRSTRSSGDAFLLWQRIIHEGDVLGTPGRGMVLATGLLPPLMMISGLLMWLRKRRQRLT